MEMLRPAGHDRTPPDAFSSVEISFGGIQRRSSGVPYGMILLSQNQCFILIK